MDRPNGHRFGVDHNRVTDPCQRGKVAAQIRLRACDADHSGTCGCAVGNKIVACRCLDGEESRRHSRATVKSGHDLVCACSLAQPELCIHGADTHSPEGSPEAIGTGVVVTICPNCDGVDRDEIGSAGEGTCVGLDQAG